MSCINAEPKGEGELRALAEFVEFTVPIRINSLGYRGHEFAMKKGFLFLFLGMRSMCLMSNCELMCFASFSFTSSERDDFWPPLGPVFRRAIGLGTALGTAQRQGVRHFRWVQGSNGFVVNQNKS
jgi:hypothetical protein